MSNIWQLYKIPKDLGWRSQNTIEKDNHILSQQQAKTQTVYTGLCRIYYRLGSLHSQPAHRRAIKTSPIYKDAQTPVPWSYITHVRQTWYIQRLHSSSSSLRRIFLDNK